MPVIHRKSAVRWGRSRVIRRPNTEPAYMPEPILLGVGLQINSGTVDIEIVTAEIGIMETSQ